MWHNLTSNVQQLSTEMVQLGAWPDSWHGWRGFSTIELTNVSVLFTVNLKNHRNFITGLISQSRWLSQWVTISSDNRRNVIYKRDRSLFISQWFKPTESSPTRHVTLTAVSNEQKFHNAERFLAPTASAVMSPTTVPVTVIQSRDCEEVNQSSESSSCTPPWMVDMQMKVWGRDTRTWGVISKYRGRSQIWAKNNSAVWKITR